MNSQLSNIRAARKVAGTIYSLKSLTMAVLIIATLIGSVGALASESTGLAVGVAVVGLLATAVTHATFGWFEHTLMLLCDIAAESMTVDAEEPGPGEHPASS